MKVIKTERGLIKAWTDGVSFDENAIQQITNVANMPFVHKHVAVMPDVHLGKGCSVGTVIATRGAIIPACVGVDIGCGMVAVQTSLRAEHLPDSLKETRDAIEAAVPVGKYSHTKDGVWSAFYDLNYGDRLKNECTWNMGAFADAANARMQLGTLGGGNHFIELCIDELGNVWVMVHSGSRGFGNRLGTEFISNAKKDMEKYYIHLPDEDLAYIPMNSTSYLRYCDAIHEAQDYARDNRTIIMDLVMSAMKSTLGEFVTTSSAVNCHHNYVSYEHHFGSNVMVTRKGAIDASLGKLGIIPGSMGAKSFIVRGKGNADSFHSCSHGAGRVLSRGQASKQISLKDHEAATMGVECRKDESVLDESPAAYKDINAVMAAQSDLVDVVHTLKQVLCVKG